MPATPDATTQVSTLLMTSPPTPVVLRPPSPRGRSPRRWCLGQAAGKTPHASSLAHGQRVPAGATVVAKLGKRTVTKRNAPGSSR